MDQDASHGIAQHTSDGNVAAVEDELRRSAAQLRASEAQFRSLVENSSDIIHVIDENRIIRYVSPAVKRLLGYEPEDLIGTPGNELLHPDDQAIAAEIVAQIMSEGPPSGRGAVQRLRHRDGSWRSFEVTGARILDVEARPTLVAISRDVTERERLAAERRDLEEQLRQSQKMEAVGRLAGGIAHNFNNLLTAIDGHAQLVLNELDAENSMHQDIVEIHRSAQRAAELTRQLLAFARKQVLMPCCLDLGAVVHRLQSVFEHLLGDEVEVRIGLARGTSCVEADPTQIEHVLLDLVMNARDAMPHGGRLSVMTANAELDEAAGREFSPRLPPGPYVVLSIADTGTGMDSETQDCIFEPFFSTRPVGAGTGLGLSTAHGIIRQSGGDIAVESEVGHGTTFRVYLPRSDAPA